MGEEVEQSAGCQKRLSQCL